MITPKQVRAAEEQAASDAGAVLCKTERGRRVAASLLAFFDAGGDALDAHGQDAVLTLLGLHFASLPGTVRDVLSQAAVGKAVPA